MIKRIARIIYRREMDSSISLSVTWKQPDKIDRDMYNK